LEDAELCTFKPDISKTQSFRGVEPLNPGDFSTSVGQSPHSSNTSLYKRMISWKQGKDQNISKKAEKLKRDNSKELTFLPKTNTSRSPLRILKKPTDTKGKNKVTLEMQMRSLDQHLNRMKKGIESK
jgi:hypothetical protein